MKEISYPENIKELLSAAAELLEVKDVRFDCYPIRIGTVAGVDSFCGKLRIFLYAMVGDRRQLFDDAVGSETGLGLFICKVESLELLGAGREFTDFDKWADAHCTLVCNC